MLFHDTFNPTLGSVILIVIVLLLVGFSVCINLLITRECSSKSKLAPLKGDHTVDKEYTDMHISGLDSSLQHKGDGDTLTSVVTMGAVNTSIQSALVNLTALKKKKDQKRRNRTLIIDGPRTSSPKPKSKLALSPKKSSVCPSPSAKYDFGFVKNKNLRGIFQICCENAAKSIIEPFPESLNHSLSNATEML